MTQMQNNLKKLHFSGHETFPLRYTWLPKIVRMVNENGKITDEPFIVRELGVGQNMARAIRHWAESTQMVTREGRDDYKTTYIADTLFSNKGDPYLERRDSIWLLHYLICSNSSKNTLWYYLFNYYTKDLIVQEKFLQDVAEFCRGYSTKSFRMSTLERDFKCCMSMYAVTDPAKTKDMQNLLASPMKELRLVYALAHHGEYSLRRITSKEISSELFAFCLLDYLDKMNYPSSVGIDQILLEATSPGRLFRLAEAILVDYLVDFEQLSQGKYIYDSTLGTKQILRNSDVCINKKTWIERVYR